MRSFVQLAHSAVLWPWSLCIASACGSDGGLVVTVPSNAVGPPSTPGTNSPLAVPFRHHQPRQQHPLVGEAVFQGPGPRGCLSTLGPLNLMLPHFRTGRLTHNSTLPGHWKSHVHAHQVTTDVLALCVERPPVDWGLGPRELSSCGCAAFFAYGFTLQLRTRTPLPSSVVIPVTTVYCGSSPALRLAHFVLGTLSFSSLCNRRQHYTSSIELPVKATLQIYQCKVKSR